MRFGGIDGELKVGSMVVGGRRPVFHFLVYVGGEESTTQELLL